MFLLGVKKKKKKSLKHNAFPVFHGNKKNSQGVTAAFCLPWYFKKKFIKAASCIINHYVSIFYANYPFKTAFWKFSSLAWSFAPGNRNCQFSLQIHSFYRQNKKWINIKKKFLIKNKCQETGPL